MRSAGTADEARSRAGWSASLLRWYDRNRRDLPWRRTRDPYAVWISEVMLQQTTVAAVQPFYERWLKLFPDIRALARSSERRILKAWQGLGYYQRARNLRAAARILVRDLGGRLPDEESRLRALPGFGPYTTAAVLSIAFGAVVPLIDANVRRVVMRVFGLRGPAGSGRDSALLERLAPLQSRERPGDFNQAMMELGALVCRSKNPLCPACPLRRACAALALGEQEIIPSPRKRSYRRLKAVVAVIVREGRVLIQRRPAEGLLGGLWEFPGGKVKPGESLKAAMARELEEELGCRLKTARPFMVIDHSYTRYKVRLHAFKAEIEGRPRLDPRRRAWVAAARLEDYPFPSGSARIVEALRDGRSRGASPGARRVRSA